MEHGHPRARGGHRPLFGLGLWLGSKLFGKASEELFRSICYALIAVSALISLPLFDGIFH